MSIAEKLITVAENVPKVYEAGQKSMVDESKIIEKTVSGSVIAVDDVSEVPHKVSVQLSSDTVTDFSGVAVKVLGKNLFDKDNGIIIDGYIGGTINTVANAYKTVAIPCAPNTTYTISRIAGTRFEAGTTLEYPKNGTVVYDNVRDYTGASITITTGADAKYLVAYVWNNSTDTSISATEMINSIQIELGSSATEYEPYSEKIYTAEADGSVKGIKSISPNMTIYSDGEGVNITATYHKSWGMQTEYDKLTLEVTNNMTVNNTRVHYTNIFSYGNWSGFKFAYPIKPTGNIGQFFYNSPLTELPTPLDFSEIMTKTSNNSYTYRKGVFGYCSNLKEIDFSAETGMNMRAIDGIEEWFQGCRKLETIKALNVNEITIYTNTFQLCDALVNLTFANGSVIGKSLDLHWSTKLSMTSLASIVGCLSKTVSGQTITLPTTARATYDNATISGSWDNLVKQYTNWTFAYA